VATRKPVTGPGSAAGSGSYEAARDALAGIVTALETGGLPLEESLALWERGERLAEECERWLAGARERLERGTTPVAGADEDRA
jgi:exodeoxyribonuclease VII small subunit